MRNLERTSGLNPRFYFIFKIFYIRGIFETSKRI